MTIFERRRNFPKTAALSFIPHLSPSVPGGGGDVHDAPHARLPLRPRARLQRLVQGGRGPGDRNGRLYVEHHGR